jgi:hypothetical protein
MSNSNVVYEVIDGYENMDNVAEYIVYLFQAKDKGNDDLYALKMYMKNVHQGKCVRFLDGAMDFARMGMNDSSDEFGSAAFFAELALAEIEGLNLQNREIVCKSDGKSRKIGYILKNYIEFRKTIQKHVDKMWAEHMDHMKLQTAIESSNRNRRVIEVSNISNKASKAA